MTISNATPLPGIPGAAEVARLGKEAEARWTEFDEGLAVPADIYEQVALQGLFRQLVPTELGGLGHSPLEWFRTGVTLARHEPSLGWVVSQGAAVMGHLASGGEPAWVGEVLADPTAAAAASIAGGGSLTADDGDFRFSGSWSFTSGCESATWLGGLAVVSDAHGNATDIRWALVPADRARIDRTWNSAGLRGTGSHTVTVDEQVIPAAWTYRTHRVAPHRTDAHACTVGNGNWPIGTSVSAIQLGTARRALDEVTALLPHKAPAPDFQPLSTSSTVQRGLMEAEGLWRGALAGVEAVLTRMWAVAQERRRFDAPLRVEIATANATANRLAVEVVDRACELAGTSMVAVDHPLGRCLRDATTLRGHISANAAVLERAARVHLGTEEPGPLV